jgi:uncharacterized phage-associated protein
MPVSNLKMQKLLYYIQGEFLVIKNRQAFFESIYAWKHGPVVPEVYYVYNTYVANVIRKKPDNFNEKQFENNDIEIFDKVINYNLDNSAWDLVDKTHRETPWIKNYSDAVNNIIPVEDMKDYFKRNKRV